MIKSKIRRERVKKYREYQLRLNTVGVNILFEEEKENCMI